MSKPGVTSAGLELQLDCIGISLGRTPPPSCRKHRLSNLGSASSTRMPRF
jgi:hypothetical protein